jgi:predicted acyl esterase
MTRSMRTLLIPALLWICTGLSAYTKQTIMIPMRDGVHLATDIYQPSLQTGRLPCLLMRTPYNKDSGIDDWVMTLLTDLTGYAIAIQDMRGKHASEGIDTVYFSDGWGKRRDGYDTVEWLADQSWSNGRIGMIGASASGIVSYLAAGATPPHLACCVVAVAASNLYEDAIFYGGEYQKALVNGWLEEHGDSDLIPFFTTHHDDGPVYEPVNLTARFDSVNVPMLHAGGWHDIFIQSTINAFSGIQKSGGTRARGNQRLIIGPWTHNIASEKCGELSFPDAGIMQFLDSVIGWVDHWLRDKPMPLVMPAVQFYLMGDADRTDGPGNRWIRTDSWPPETGPVSLFLRSGGTLSFDRPGSDEPPDAFDFDPSLPVPTLGGRNLNLRAGSVDQRPVESRDDVRIYTTDELTDAVAVAGRITVRLFAASDALDTDFTAKLCDVYPDGRSMLVADGIVQARHRISLESETLLTPGEAVEFAIDLWSTAVVFAPGHRIRVDVSSSNYPRFEVNPNTGKPVGADMGAVVARQTVYHDAIHPSALELPILQGSSGGPEGAASDFALGQNYPNPFSAETFIPVFIPEELNADAEIRLEILNALGRPVRHLALDPAPGQQSVRWDGTGDNSVPLPSGVYIALLRSGADTRVRKMAILK